MATASKEMDGCCETNLGREPARDAGHTGSEHVHAHSQEAAPPKRTRLRGSLILYQLGGSVVLYAAAIVSDQYVWREGGIAFYLLAILLCGASVFWRGLRNLVRLRFNMDTLMTMALIGASAIGEWREAALVSILFGLNEWLEGLGMRKARRSIESLLRLAPKQALRVGGGREEWVPVETLRPGDVVQVRPGDQIPSDGTVLEGRGSVDESAVTGESLPVDKGPGASVYGGSLNRDGMLRVAVDRPYAESSLARILELVRKAQEGKTPTQLLISRFARIYSPLVLAAAILVAVVPPLAAGGEWMRWIYEGLAVLIVGCPCALILSSPVALLSGMTVLARNGILVRSGAFLEKLGKIQTIAMDKTGTLTYGRPVVVETVDYGRPDFSEASAALAGSSSHPLSVAIRDHLNAAAEPEPVTDVRNLPGQGFEAEWRGRHCRMGNESLLRPEEKAGAAGRDAERMKEAGLSVVAVADEEGVLGLYGLADEVRPESAGVVRGLNGLRVRPVMLTGDHARTAEQVARQTGIGEWHAGMMPEGKAAWVREQAASGTVAMIGDGVNDAPALASAHLGMAMGKGSDSAIETADVVLMQDHLGKLPFAIRTARRVNAIIRLNLTIALGLKAAALLLTIPGWLTLWFAILSDMGATIAVTLISLTVLLSKPREQADAA